MSNKFSFIRKDWRSHSFSTTLLDSTYECKHDVCPFFFYKQIWVNAINKFLYSRRHYDQSIATLFIQSKVGCFFYIAANLSLYYLQNVKIGITYICSISPPGSVCFTQSSPRVYFYIFGQGAADKKATFSIKKSSYIFVRYHW